MFQTLERTFHDLEHTFLSLKYTFQILEHKIPSTKVTISPNTRNKNVSFHEKKKRLLYYLTLFVSQNGSILRYSKRKRCVI